MYYEIQSIRFIKNNDNYSDPSSILLLFMNPLCEVCFFWHLVSSVFFRMMYSDEQHSKYCSNYSDLLMPVLRSASVKEHLYERFPSINEKLVHSIMRFNFLISAVVRLE